MKGRCFFSCVFLALFIAVETQRGLVYLRNCNKNNDCGAIYGYICGQNQTCHCERFYTINFHGDKCVGGVGQKCKYDEHCIEGAFCEFQQRCQCKDELYPSEDGFACSKSKQTFSCQPHIYVTAGLLLYKLFV